MFCCRKNHLNKEDLGQNFAQNDAFFSMSDTANMAIIQNQKLKKIVGGLKMININKVIFTLAQVANSDIVFITEVRPVKEYQEGKPTEKILGYSYTVVCPANKFEAFIIKVEQQQPAITHQELESRGGTVKAKVKGFQGKFYQNKNKEILFTARATEMEIVP